eukprot:2815520-Prymnesium_polylepis.1
MHVCASILPLSHRIHHTDVHVPIDERAAHARALAGLLLALRRTRAHRAATTRASHPHHAVCTTNTTPD